MTRLKTVHNPDQIYIPRDLLPVSRVMLRTLMQPSYDNDRKNQIVEYLREVQHLWQAKQDPKKASHAGAYYLILAYKDLEEKKIITSDGRILRPRDFATNKNLNGFWCRPIGFPPILFQKTAEFAKLANRPNMAAAMRNQPHQA